MPAERRSPAVGNSSIKKGGTDEMTKASISVQDLRRRIYIKAKAEPAWRFWEDQAIPDACAEAQRLRLEEVE